jgi:hypothetical protein
VTSVFAASNSCVGPCLVDPRIVLLTGKGELIDSIKFDGRPMIIKNSFEAEKLIFQMSDKWLTYDRSQKVLTAILIPRISHIAAAGEKLPVCTLNGIVYSYLEGTKEKMALGQSDDLIEEMFLAGSELIVMRQSGKVMVFLMLFSQKYERIFDIVSNIMSSFFDLQSSRVIFLNCANEIKAINFCTVCPPHFLTALSVIGFNSNVPSAKCPLYRCRGSLKLRHCSLSSFR